MRLTRNIGDPTAADIPQVLSGLSYPRVQIQPDIICALDMVSTHAVLWNLWYRLK